MVTTVFVLKLSEWCLTISRNVLITIQMHVWNKSEQMWKRSICRSTRQTTAVIFFTKTFGQSDARTHSWENVSCFIRSRQMFMFQIIASSSAKDVAVVLTNTALWMHVERRRVVCRLFIDDPSWYLYKNSKGRGLTMYGLHVGASINSVQGRLPSNHTPWILASIANEYCWCRLN